MRYVKYISLVLLSLVLLTGCWDKEELENRGFVISMGIDSFDSDSEENKIDTKDKAIRYSLSMTLPNISDLEGQGGEETKSIKKGVGETVSGAMRNIAAHSSRKIDYGHTKASIFGEEILSDSDLFKEAIDALERNTELSGKLIILATDERAEKILMSKVTDDPIIGLFISNFYKKNSSSTAIAFRNDLQRFVQDLRLSGSAIIPKITLEDENLHLGGAGVIKDFKLVGWLDDDDIKGYLWANSPMLDEQIVAQHNDIYVPLRVTKKKDKLSFFYNDGKLYCSYGIYVEGDVEEYKFLEGSLFNEEMIRSLEMEYKKVVESDLKKTWDAFQTRYKTDGFSIKDQLKKKNYNLYKQLEMNWEEEFEKMQLLPNIEVRIKNAGAIK